MIQPGRFRIGRNLRFRLRYRYPVGFVNVRPRPAARRVGLAPVRLSAPRQPGDVHPLLRVPVDHLWGATNERSGPRYGARADAPVWNSRSATTLADLARVRLKWRRWVLAADIPVT